MQLNLDTFNKNISTEDRIDETIASGISFNGLDKIPHLQELLNDILSNYELDKGVLRLAKEYCDSCNNKLKRKGTYKKEIVLPGGATILLTFYQYSCENCKSKVDRKLGSWFQKKERYSSNVKGDAIRLYLSHLSSYETVRQEINKLYCINVSKRTVRKWLSKVGKDANSILLNEIDFSGHFVYDEEYLKVFLGDAGKKNSKLQRVEVYLLLFRDAKTGKPIIMLSDSLDKSCLLQHWRRFIRWTISNNIPFLTLTTDGKREYNALINNLNHEFGLKIRHAYCVFHYKKNLYEVSNKEIFGVMHTKKELPKHVENQIEELGKVIDSPTKKAFEEGLQNLEFQRQTFISALQDQIKRLRKYNQNYSLHKEFPFLRTTNVAEHWFGQTKPEKLKKGYKTKGGILRIAQALAVKICNTDWKTKLNATRDINDATFILISGLTHKRNIKPA